jgi:hypothetical protein
MVHAATIAVWKDLFNPIGPGLRRCWRLIHANDWNNARWASGAGNRGALAAAASPSRADGGCAASRLIDWQPKVWTC